jgi:hypothetical protein
MQKPLRVSIPKSNPFTLKRLIALGVTVAPAVAWASGFRRECRIILVFATHEFIDHYLVVTILGLALILRSTSPRTINDIRFHWGLTGLAMADLWTRTIWLRRFLGVLTLCWFVVYYVPLRYRILSESYYPGRAINGFATGQFDDARSLCDTYLALYPRKGPKGPNKDFTCASVKELTSTASAFQDYISSVDPEPRRLDNMVIPPAEEARTVTLRMLRLWSGTSPAKPTDKP